MHNSPVYTRVINLTDKDRSVMLWGKKVVSIPANAEVEVPYEVWSLASPTQQKTLTSILASGDNLRLIVGVRNPSGVYVETELGLSTRTVAAPVSAPAELPVNMEEKKDFQQKMNETLESGKKSRKKMAKSFGIVDLDEDGEDAALDLDRTLIADKSATIMLDNMGAKLTGSRSRKGSSKA